MGRLFLLLVVDHFRHRPFRAVLTVLGVSIGVSAWLAIRLANGEVDHSFQESVESVVGPASISVSGGMEGLDEALIAVIQRHPGVKRADPILKIEASLSHASFADRTLVIWGVDILEYAQDLQTGDWKEPGSAVERDRFFSTTTVFLGEEFAHELNVTPGEALAVRVANSTHQLSVGGLLSLNDPRLRGAGRQALMDIAAAQWLFGWLGRVHYISVIPEAGVSIPSLIQSLLSVVPQDVRISQSTRRTGQVQSMLKAFQFNLSMLSGIALFVGVFLVYNTMAFSVTQHRREIGILRSLGMERRAITTLFLLEASFLGMVGGGVGCWLGVMLSKGMMRLIEQSVGELYGVTTSAVAPLDAGVLLEAIGIGTGVSLVGAFRPSWDASSIAPVRALREGLFEEDEAASYSRAVWIAVLAFAVSAMLSSFGPVDGIPVGGYAAAFCLLVGGTATAPLLCKFVHEGRRWWPGRQGGLLPSLAADQMSRNPGRTSVTMAAIVVGLAIMVGVGIMIQSFRHTVEMWVEQTMMADLLVAPVAWLGDQEVEQRQAFLPLHLIPSVENIPGVEAVDPYVETAGYISGKSVSLVARDLALHAERSRYLFTTGESRQMLRKTIQDQGVIVSEVLAGRLGLAVGSDIVLETPSGDRVLSISGIFYDYATDGGKVVMDLNLFRQLYETIDPSVFAVYVRDGHPLPGVRQALEQHLHSRWPVTTISNGELRAEILNIFDRTFRVTYVLELIALSVAVLGIINSLMTGITERRRELATLRAIGMSRFQVQGLIFFESCYVAGLGAMVGILVGLALSVLLVNVINKQSFGWSLQFIMPWTTVGMAVVVAMFAAIIGAWGPAHWASRQSIAPDLRYE